MNEKCPSFYNFCGHFFVNTPISIYLCISNSIIYAQRTKQRPNFPPLRKAASPVLLLDGSSTPPFRRRAEDSIQKGVLYLRGPHHGCYPEELRPTERRSPADSAIQIKRGSIWRNMKKDKTGFHLKALRFC